MLEFISPFWPGFPHLKIWSEKVSFGVWGCDFNQWSCRLGGFGESSSLGPDRCAYASHRGQKSKGVGSAQPIPAGLRCEGGESSWPRLALTVGAHGGGANEELSHLLK